MSRHAEPCQKFLLTSLEWLVYRGSTVTRVQVPLGLKPAEQVLNEAFQLLGCEPWGGPSQNGWSKVSDYLRCPYRYYLKHLVEARAQGVAAASAAQDIGSFVHAILAAHYASFLVDERYPGFRPRCPSVENLIVALKTCGAEPLALGKAEHLWWPYLDRWAEDGFGPLAVEMPVGDPELHTSRYDLVVDVLDGLHDGVWICEHKTLSPSTDVEIYQLDGEILGECLSWRLSHLDDMFGPLLGVCLNVLVKSATPTYRRLWWPVNWDLVNDFGRNRMHWQATINARTKQNIFPKSHYGCAARFDRCLFWDHCSTLSPSFLTLEDLTNE